MSDDLSIPSPTYRVPRQRRGLDPNTRKLAIIAGGLGAVLVVVVGGWSLIGHRNTTVPVVQADNRPIRVKPDNPGGLQVAGANEDILSGTGDSASGKLAPPPEVPAPQALRAPPPKPAAPVVAAPRPAQPVAAAPADPPVPAASSVVPAKPTTAPAEKPTTTERPTQAGAKGVLVQLAAVRSEAAAKSEWQRLSKRMPDLLGQHRPAFTRTDHDGRELWRVRTGGFDDVTHATRFCAQVRAKGAACTVADF